MRIGSKECQKHFLGLLEKDERIEKNGNVCPKSQGLLCLCLREVGAISCYTQILSFPSEVKNTDLAGATVKTSVELTPYTQDYYPIKGTYTFEGACDIGNYNTDKNFHLHSVATAETISMGRALKKALGLNVSTSDEMNGAFNAYNIEEVNQKLTSMTANQKKLITSTLDNLGIELNAYLALKKLNLLEFQDCIITKEKAEEVLNELQKWKTNPKLVKKELRADG